MIVCSKCSVPKADHWFPLGISKGVHYRSKVCVDCRNKRQKEGRKSRGNQYRYDQQLQYKYGICRHEWSLRLQDQDHKCAGCGNDFGNQINVDHCHETGTVRGLLCSGCNFAIGHAKDSPDILRKLADYLEKTR